MKIHTEQFGQAAQCVSSIFSLVFFIGFAIKWMGILFLLCSQTASTEEELAFRSQAKLRELLGFKLFPSKGFVNLQLKKDFSTCLPWCHYEDFPASKISPEVSQLEASCAEHFTEPAKHNSNVWLSISKSLTHRGMKCSFQSEMQRKHINV